MQRERGLGLGIARHETSVLPISQIPRDVCEPRNTNPALTGIQREIRRWGAPRFRFMAEK
jgi:hypothetical protein